MPSKYLEIMKTVSTRIRRGDYHSENLPSEKVLAAEFGVSYMTARRAVKELINAGLLIRGSTARLAMPEIDTQPHIQLAFAMPSRAMRSLGDWIESIELVAGENNAILRLIPYLDSDDPALIEALGNHYSATFLMAIHPMRNLIVNRLKCISRRVVTLFDHFDDWNVPSLDDTPTNGVACLIDYLVGLGHRRIDCVNAQEVLPLVQESVKTWKEAIANRGLEGTYYDFSDLDHGLSEMRAYLGTNALLGQRNRPTAILCTTVAAARGIYRAAYEHRMQVGRDISICARGSYARARLMTPSLTCQALPEREPYIRMALKWMLSNSSDTLLPTDGFRPKNSSLHAGESCVAIAPSV